MTEPEPAALDQLFAPQSIAIVGASDDPAKWGNWLARQALAGDRPVHLVNARSGQVLGRATVPSLRDIDGVIGLAVVAVPAAAFEATVDDALAMGVRAIVGISAGLGESGDEGQQLERSIAERVRAAGAVLLGPNCLGVFDAGSALSLTSNPLPAGGVAFVSQSGNLSLELARLLVEHDLGFSRFVSLGNQAQLEAAHLVKACAHHPGTDVVAVYCEDFRDGRRFIDAAREARSQGKPVVLLTVGASEAAARQASSHTASLVSPSAVVDAACAAAGVIRVHTPQQMADVLALLSTRMRPSGSRVAVLTDGGGHASIAADVATSFGLSVPEFSEQLSREVARELPSGAATANPVDVAGGGEQDIFCFSRVAAAVLGSQEVDSLVLSGYFGGYVDYSPSMGPAEVQAAKSLAAVAHATGRTLLVHSMYSQSEAASALRASGGCVFRTIEGAIGALTAACTLSLESPELSMPVAGEPIAEVDYWSARGHLVDQQIPFPKAHQVFTRSAVLDAARQLKFPLVLKAMGLLHKSDVGGVVLAIDDESQLLAAYDRVQTALAPQSLTVEEMVDTSQGVELIVGVRRDARFGPVVMVGIGGVFTEVLDDVATALAPVEPAAAQRLLASLRGSGLLQGVRGRPAVDTESVAAVVSAVSQFAARHPEIAELEINPLLATPSGVVALDARMILSRDPQKDTL